MLNHLQERHERACESLLNGCNYCVYRTIIFNYFHLKVDDVIVIYLDFETTGLELRARETESETETPRDRAAERLWDCEREILTLVRTL